MASDTASGTGNLPSLRVLHRRVTRILERRQEVPLLVLRLPELERVAWRKGALAARRLERDAVRSMGSTARRVTRTEDTFAHDTGSDCFVVAMLSGSRKKRRLDPTDCRAALERVEAAMTRQTKRRIEGGWWAFSDPRDAANMQRSLTRALERGARERERYEFLAELSHELRTPLASIRGYLESVLEPGGDPQRVRRYLETAQRETLRLGRIVDGMLEFSLLDLSPSLGVRACDAVEQIGAAIEALRPLAVRRRITLAVDAAGATPVRIEADACMHVLLNLIDNAIVHGRSGSVVYVSCAMVGECAEIAIEGEGPWRSATASHGHGFGLRIARTIAERAGGKVHLDRSASGGVRAIVSLPAARGSEEAEVAGSVS